jgi:hypothetical protein
MTSRQLRLLRVLALELVSERVEELHVRLLRVPCQRGDECLEGRA